MSEKLILQKPCADELHGKWCFDVGLCAKESLSSFRHFIENSCGKFQNCINVIEEKKND